MAEKKSLKKQVQADLEKITVEATPEKEPNLFGKKDELINAISTEMADLTTRAEALEKRIESAEEMKGDLEGRLHNLRLLLKDLRG